MNKLIKLLFLVALAGFSSNAFAQGCSNADFSDGNFNGWTGRTGSCCGIVMNGNGIVNGRHTIMTGNGTDPVACNDISVVAPGFTSSARLGNSGSGCEAERLSYTYTVTNASALFVYQYAVVLEDPGHSVADQPRFEIRVLNSNGQLISQQCGYYAVTAAGQIQGFRSCGSVRYRAWTPVGIDLSGLVGQTVTVEFTTGDCGLCGHFGYAYVVAECDPLEIQVDYCPSNSNEAILTAPNGFSYNWSTGETSRSISIANPANGSQYSCELTAVTGCQVTVNATITSTAVAADFTFPPPCPGLPIQFTDQTVSNIGNIATWEWDFGDGNTSNLQNPTHTYTSSGLYNVTLTATTGGGCEGEITYQADVNPYPQAGFLAPPVCDGTPATLINNTLFPPTIGSFSWDFGDGSPLNTTDWNATHTYPTPGNYDATLIAYSQNGVCTDTVEEVVAIAALPIADFDHTDTCFGQPTPFTNTSLGTVTNSTWRFGDNTPPNYTANPTHDYISPGTYDVTLRVISQQGCIDSTTIPVTVFAKPFAEIDFNNVCSDKPVDFINLSTIPPPDNTINDWLWDFGDGSPTNSNDWEPTHFYAAPGVYDVTFIAYSNNLVCTDTVVDSVRVYEPPTVDFTFENVCVGQAMTFYDSSDGEVTSWEWDFGDNTAPNYNPIVSYTYGNSGPYDVQLKVSTVYGCTDSLTQTVIVYNSPAASFTAEEVCHEEPTEFISTATVPGASNITRYAWNLADGNFVLNASTYSHTYAIPGNFNVTHTVTSSDGCVDSIVQTVTVHPNPVVQFVGDPLEGCSPVCVDFQDLSGIMTGFNEAWEWDYGDGNGSNEQNPDYCYKNLSGNVLLSSDVTLKVTSNEGCETSLRKDNYVNVYPSPTSNFNAEPKVTSILFPDVTFSDGSANASNWLWHFGDLQVNNLSTLQNPVYTFKDTGTFLVTQVVYNEYGCADTSDLTIIITPDFTIYIPNTFTPDDNEVNDIFYVSGIGIVDFEIRIFDRWGETMYFSQNINQGWDGKIRGKDKFAKQDVYVYNVSITDLLGESYTYYGKVTLLK